MLATKRDLVAKKNYQYYLITNTRGDVIETRNGDGNVNAKFVYDAWGKLVAVTNASGTPLASYSFAYQISLKYRGYVYDNETGLYYLQSRYYDPEIGRFLNADDVEYIGYSGEQLSYNAFAYCGNEPVCWADFNGKDSINLVLKFLSNLLVRIFAPVAFSNRLYDYDSEFADKIFNYEHMRQNEVDTFKGVNRYTYIFRDSLEVNATKYYINFDLGTKESWESYCEYYKNLSFTNVNIFKYIFLTLIAIPFPKAGLILGTFDFIIGESGVLESEKLFASSSSAVINTSSSNYFIAIRGIIKLEGCEEKMTVIYGGDQHIWPAVMQ